MTRCKLAWPLALLALTGVARPANAHRLDTQCVVLPGWRVQVESWYETGEPPPGARVEVYRADGRLLTAGKLDKNGVFVFSFVGMESLKVVVTSVGHRAETTVPAEALARATTCTCVACLSPRPTPFLPTALLLPALRTHEREQSAQTAEPVLHEDPPFPLAGALAGVGILLAVAAFVRFRRRMRTDHAPGDRGKKQREGEQSIER